MIRSFYKYVRNQYLGDYLNNLVCEESIWMIFICASMSIKMKCYMFLFIENTNEWEWEGWISITIFPIDSSKSFTLILFNFLQIHYTHNLSTKFYILSYI